MNPVAFSCLGDLVAMVPKDQVLHELQKVPGGIDARVDQLKAQVWAWVLARQVR